MSEGDPTPMDMPPGPSLSSADPPKDMPPGPSLSLANPPKDTPPGPSLSSADPPKDMPPGPSLSSVDTTTKDLESAEQIEAAKSLVFLHDHSSGTVPSIVSGQTGTGHVQTGASPGTKLRKRKAAFPKKRQAVHKPIRNLSQSDQFNELFSEVTSLASLSVIQSHAHAQRRKFQVAIPRRVLKTKTLPPAKVSNATSQEKKLPPTKITPLASEEGEVSLPTSTEKGDVSLPTSTGKLGLRAQKVKKMFQLRKAREAAALTALRKALEQQTGNKINVGVTKTHPPKPAMVVTGPSDTHTAAASRASDASSVVTPGTSSDPSDVPSVATSQTGAVSKTSVLSPNEASEVSTTQASHKTFPKSTFTSKTLKAYLPPSTKKGVAVAQKIQKLIQARRARSEARAAKRRIYAQKPKPLVIGNKPSAIHTKKGVKSKKKAEYLDLAAAATLSVSQALSNILAANSNTTSVSSTYSVQPVMSKKVVVSVLDQPTVALVSSALQTIVSTSSAGDTVSPLKDTNVISNEQTDVEEPSSQTSNDTNQTAQTGSTTTPVSTVQSTSAVITTSVPHTSMAVVATTSSETNPSKISSASKELPTVGTVQPENKLTLPPINLRSLLSSLDTMPKGLNLPVLDFLRVNFPSLRLDNLEDILQVNALLAQTLQMQQQVLQAQETAVSIASAGGLTSTAKATTQLNKQSADTRRAEPSILTDMQKTKPLAGSQPVVLGSPVIGTGQTGFQTPQGTGDTVRKGKTPVLVQIIRSQATNTPVRYLLCTCTCFPQRTPLSFAKRI